MFDRRVDLIKFLAVAETGKIVVAADKLAITQPALSRVIARLEEELDGPLFERIPSGVRLTSLGVVAADLARHILREMEAAKETIDSAVSGGLFLMGRRPYLSWLSLAFLQRLPGLLLEPLPLELGTLRYRTGIISRRSAERLSPFRRLEEIVRDVALGRGG